jgi:hypothetical protein
MIRVKNVRVVIAKLEYAETSILINSSASSGRYPENVMFLFLNAKNDFAPERAF